jgi:hypothetical protein
MLILMSDTQHRAARRAGRAGPARTTDERKLEAVQRKIEKAAFALREATEERDILATKLWHGGMAQAEIAERLDRASREAGGPGYGYAALQKRLHRVRP